MKTKVEPSPYQPATLILHHWGEKPSIFLSARHEMDEVPTTRSSKSTPTPPQSSPSTTVTTPDQSPGLDDDIWDTSSDHGHDGRDPHAHDQQSFSALETAPEQIAPENAQPSRILSDVPSLRRQHMTSGYREGLSVGKAQVMQAGFDAGYPFGVEIGLRVGTVLGALEGILAALTATAAKKGVGSSHPSGASDASTGMGGKGKGQDVAHEAGQVDFVRKLSNRAQAELQITEMMKSLDDEMIARLDDPSAGGDGEVGGERQVPQEIEEVVKKWEEIVLGSLRRDAEGAGDEGEGVGAKGKVAAEDGKGKGKATDP